ncbi:testis-expressed protein 15 [Eublepharis macularius]|uniref:Testis-expressed protein 15 n=1 Tax=Eublepharis macularius TaxID=481883 RepID=A0AA97L643_EUBMA|nr:testis-expressed protein 15 [Eublepharis macularius]
MGPGSDFLTECPTNQRDYNEVKERLTQSCFDTECNLESSWHFDKIQMVHNKDLEEAFVAKRTQIREQGRMDKEFSGFLVVVKDEVLKICQSGLRTSNSIKKELDIMKELGNPQLGVYLFRHVDIALNYASKYSVPVENIIIFRVLLGKVKKIQPPKSKKKIALDPTPKFDCHISRIHPSLKDSIEDQAIGSLVYFYEYSELSKPVDKPRQCLPHAVVKVKCVNQKVRADYPVVSSKCRPKSFSKETLNYSVQVDGTLVTGRGQGLLLENCTIVTRIGNSELIYEHFHKSKNCAVNDDVSVEVSSLSGSAHNWNNSVPETPGRKIKHELLGQRDSAQIEADVLNVQCAPGVDCSRDAGSDHVERSSKNLEDTSVPDPLVNYSEFSTIITSKSIKDPRLTKKGKNLGEQNGEQVSHGISLCENKLKYKTEMKMSATLGIPWPAFNQEQHVAKTPWKERISGEHQSPLNRNDEHLMNKEQAIDSQNIETDLAVKTSRSSLNSAHCGIKDANQVLAERDEKVKYPKPFPVQTGHKMLDQNENHVNANSVVSSYVSDSTYTHNKEHSVLAPPFQISTCSPDFESATADKDEMEMNSQLQEDDGYSSEAHCSASLDSECSSSQRTPKGDDTKRSQEKKNEKYKLDEKKSRLYHRKKALNTRSAEMALPLFKGQFETFEQSEKHIKNVLHTLNTEASSCKNKHLSRKISGAMFHLQKAQRSVQKYLKILAKTGKQKRNDSSKSHKILLNITSSDSELKEEIEQTSLHFIKKMSEILQKADETLCLNVLREQVTICQKILPLFIRAFEEKQNCSFEHVLVLRENAEKNIWATLKPCALDCFLNIQIITEVVEFIKNKRRYLEGKRTVRSLLWYDDSLCNELFGGQSGYQQQTNFYPAFQMSLKYNALNELRSHHKKLLDKFENTRLENKSYYCLLKLRREITECEAAMKTNSLLSEFFLSEPYICGANYGDTIEELENARKDTVDLINTCRNLSGVLLNTEKMEHLGIIMDIISTKIDFIRTCEDGNIKSSFIGLEHIFFNAAVSCVWKERSTFMNGDFKNGEGQLLRIYEAALPKLYEIYEKNSNCASEKYILRKCAEEPCNYEKAAVKGEANDDIGHYLISYPDICIGEILDEAQSVNLDKLKEHLCRCTEHLEVLKKYFQIIQEEDVDQVLITKENALRFMNSPSVRAIRLKPEAVEVYTDLAMLYETINFLQNSIARKEDKPQFRSLLWFDLSLLNELLQCQINMASFCYRKGNLLEMIESAISDLQDELNVVYDYAESLNCSYALQLLTREHAELLQIREHLETSASSICMCVDLVPYTIAVNYGSNLTELEYNYEQFNSFFEKLMLADRKDLGKMAHVMKILRTIEHMKFICTEQPKPPLHLVICQMLKNWKKSRQLKKQGSVKTRTDENGCNSSNHKRPACITSEDNSYDQEENNPSGSKKKKTLNNQKTQTGLKDFNENRKSCSKGNQQECFAVCEAGGEGAPSEKEPSPQASRKDSPSSGPSGDPSLLDTLNQLHCGLKGSVTGDASGWIPQCDTATPLELGRNEDLHGNRPVPGCAAACNAASSASPEINTFRELESLCPDPFSTANAQTSAECAAFYQNERVEETPRVHSYSVHTYRTFCPSYSWDVYQTGSHCHQVTQTYQEFRSYEMQPLNPTVLTATSVVYNTQSSVFYSQSSCHFGVGESQSFNSAQTYPAYGYFSATEHFPYSCQPWPPWYAERHRPTQAAFQRSSSPGL